DRARWADLLRTGTSLAGKVAALARLRGEGKRTLPDLELLAELEARDQKVDRGALQEVAREAARAILDNPEQPLQSEVRRAWRAVQARPELARIEAEIRALPLRASERWEMVHDLRHGDPGDREEVLERARELAAGQQAPIRAKSRIDWTSERLDPFVGRRLMDEDCLPLGFIAPSPVTLLGEEGPRWELLDPDPAYEWMTEWRWTPERLVGFLNEVHALPEDTCTREARERAGQRTMFDQSSPSALSSSAKQSIAERANAAARLSRRP